MKDPRYVARILPLVLEAGLRGGEQHALRLLDRAVVAREQPRACLRAGPQRVRLDRRLPELVVRLHRREPHVELSWRWRWPLRCRSRRAVTRLDLLGRHHRAAGEAPDAAVDHADAEAVRLGAADRRGRRIRRRRSRRRGRSGRCGRTGLRAVAGEADVGIGAAEALGFVQRQRRPLAILRIVGFREGLVERVRADARPDQAEADCACADRMDELTACLRHGWSGSLAEAEAKPR